jgi:hypothetical protein
MIRAAGRWDASGQARVEEQRDALTTIASGRGGGPMAAVAPLISNFGGAEAEADPFEMNGMRRSIDPGVLDIAIGDMAPGRTTDLLTTWDTRQRAGSRSRRPPRPQPGSGSTGTNVGRSNGRFAPFAWSSS